MKPALAPLLVLGLLLLPIAASSHDEWPRDTPVLLAQGKAHIRLYDAQTGALLCAASALVFVERDVETRLAWTTPSCDGPETVATRAFATCSVAWDFVTCEGSDRSGADALSIARWGAFRHDGGAVDGVRVELDARLTVFTWAWQL